jgi:prophage tail gpP-like protein
MTDDVVLTIDGKAYRRLVSLSVDSSIYQASGTFDAELSATNAKAVVVGSRVQVTINGSQVFDGILERKGVRGSKESNVVSLSGRDLMGLVVDCCVERFHTLRNKTLLDVANEYLKQIDFVKRLPIVFYDGSDKIDVAQEYVQPSPGATVFDMLSGIAAARGIHFYMRPQGEMVFGKPKGYGFPPMTICNSGESNGSVLSWDHVIDISQRYSRVAVYGYAQSTSLIDASVIHKKTTVTDDQFVGFTKPYVVETQTAGVSLANQARMIIEQQRFNGW